MGSQEDIETYLILLEHSKTCPFCPLQLQSQKKVNIRPS